MDIQVILEKKMINRNKISEKVIDYLGLQVSFNEDF